MPFDTEILKDKIARIKQSYIDGQFADAMVVALNHGRALMKERVFTSNTDIEGNSFGNYIGAKHKAKLIKSSNRTQNKRNKVVAGQDLTAYQRKRLLKGRQIDHKDLDFEGTLRKAIELQAAEKESNYVAVLNFSTDKIAQIAHGQEAQISNIRNGLPGTTKGKGIKIFGFNETERQDVNDTGLELINEILKPK